MPIRPELRWLYPLDWRELSRSIRFKRARGCCEHCRRPHGQTVQHLGDGCWWDDPSGVWRDGRGRRVARPDGVERGSQASLPTTRVVLACAHLNHDPSNNSARNLAALCQRCHMLHDAVAHRRQRWATLFRRKAAGDLFCGPY